MKILIVGANGQLGSDCCKLLASENETVGCDIPVINIANPKSVEEILSDRKPDVIVNCAAYTAVDNCESERDLAWQVNAEGPGHLAAGARRIGARLIHVSTDYVFDGKKPVPAHYIEGDPTNPLSEYGKSKLAGEQAVIKQGGNYLILRTAWLYSAWGKNFLKTMLRLALSDPGREMKVVDDQYGSLTWSSTLARQISKLLRSDLSGIAHTTSEGYSSWYEAARYFLDGMGVQYAMRPCTTADYPTPAHRPANSILENGALKQAGISVFVDWREDIDLFIKQYKDQLLDEARG